MLQVKESWAVDEFVEHACGKILTVMFRVPAVAWIGVNELRHDFWQG